MWKTLAVLSVLSLAAQHAAAYEKVQVTASALNVRTGPSTGYGVIGKVYSGQKYVQVGTSGSWRKIWFSNTTGWVHGSYVTAVTATQKIVTASNLNIRTGPGSGYYKVGTAPNGSSWVIIGSSGSWQKIYYKGASRWAYGTYLSSGGSTGGGGGALPPSSAGFVQLPSSGPGFYGYYSSSKRWGVPNMVYKLMTAAQKWKEHHPTYPRIGVGDISLKNGGTISGHASHKYGKDADMRPVAKNGYEGALTRWSSTYSNYRTRHWITAHLKVYLGVKLIFFNDPNIYNNYSYVQYWNNHDNHLHLRIY